MNTTPHTPESSFGRKSHFASLRIGPCPLPSEGTRSCTNVFSPLNVTMVPFCNTSACTLNPFVRFFCFSPALEGASRPTFNHSRFCCIITLVSLCRILDFLLQQGFSFATLRRIDMFQELLRWSCGDFGEGWGKEIRQQRILPDRHSVGFMRCIFCCIPKTLTRHRCLSKAITDYVRNAHHTAMMNCIMRGGFFCPPS